MESVIQKTKVGSLILAIAMACSILANSPAVAQEQEPPKPTIESVLVQEQVSSVNTQELSDVDYLALTMWGEARGLSTTHMSYVGSVILNRTKSKKYPKTIKAVVLQPNQFMVWKHSNPNYRKMMAVHRGTLSQDAIIYQQARRIARQLLEDGPVIKALSFHSKGGKHVYF
jgi:spore germination cell wall hydrolase CwlJ-like protein